MVRQSFPLSYIVTFLCAVAIERQPVSEGGQVEFMLLGQPKYLTSQYFKSLEASDFDAMWTKFALSQEIFEEKLTKIELMQCINKIKILPNHFWKMKLQL